MGKVQKISAKRSRLTKILIGEGALLVILLAVFGFVSLRGGAGEEGPNPSGGNSVSPVSSTPSPTSVVQNTPTAVAEKTGPTGMPEPNGQDQAGDPTTNEDEIQTGGGQLSTPTPVPEPTPAEDTEALALLAEAELLAAMYDYDAALAKLTEYTGWETNPALAEAHTAFTEAKDALVVWKDNTQITHIFFHSLIVDTALAFGPNSGTVDGYNRYMTTISEFNKILEQMYEKGYVLVSIHDIAKVVTAEDGTQKLVKQEILLPEGKIPFVLSQDDVNYYDYMDNEGFATKIIVGADGKPTCEYITPEGTTITGDFDVVPLLDRFVEAHPDFSYRGAKGILAITGYEGTLGYETAPYRYEDSPKLSSLSAAEKETMLAAERAACKEAVAALKADGWEFASHSYGHGNMQTNSYTKFVNDADRWKREVEILIGATDVYIYPFGADICDWRGYSGEKYEYFKELGFFYFCNVDSAEYWIQIRDDYMRMGRINLDGERMYNFPEKVAFLIDAETVLDPTRPLPVPH